MYHPIKRELNDDVIRKREEERLDRIKQGKDYRTTDSNTGEKPDLFGDLDRAKKTIPRIRENIEVMRQLDELKETGEIPTSGEKKIYTSAVIEAMGHIRRGEYETAINYLSLAVANLDNIGKDAVDKLPYLTKATELIEDAADKILEKPVGTDYNKTVSFLYEWLALRCRAMNMIDDAIGYEKKASEILYESDIQNQ